MLEVGEILTTALARGVITEILTYLKQGKTSKKDKEKLRKNISRLVNLSNNTGCAIGCYVKLLKSSSEASTHCTELKRLLNKLPKADGEAQLTKFEDVRFQRHLRKEGIEPIHHYREDYEQARRTYGEAERHLTIAIEDYRAGKTSYVQEMEHLNRQLDDLVVIATRRIDEFIEGLREAYKVFERIS